MCSSSAQTPPPVRQHNGCTMNPTPIVPWGHYTTREVTEARWPHTCSRPCAFEEKKRNPAAPKTNHEIHSSPATATTSRRHATKHVPRVRPYSPASIDPGFVEIGLVQLSQSVRTTNVTHKQTDRQTDIQTDRLIKYWHHVRTPV